MFDHVKFGVRDYEKSKTFFLNALQPLGVELIDEGTPDYGLEMSAGDVSLCLFQTNDKPAPLHLAFVAKPGSRLMHFTRRRCVRAPGITARRAYAPTAKTTMPHLSLRLMAIILKRSAMRRTEILNLSEKPL